MRLRVDVATADVGDDAGGGRLGDISLTLTGPTALAGPFRLPTEGGARLRAGGVESWTVEGAADARPLRGAGAAGAPAQVAFESADYNAMMWAKPAAVKVLLDAGYWVHSSGGWSWLCLRRIVH